MGTLENPSQPQIVVGIDAAAQPKNIGLAKGTNAVGKFSIDDVAIGASKKEITRILQDWCEPTALIAIDAPLGWPVALGENLRGHLGGQPFDVEPNTMFRRRTDDVIHEVFGKRPLDVGADRIARTAHSALDLLGRLRKRTGQSIPLAWDPAEAGLHAIEVYPAATLLSRGLPASGYKGGKDTAVAARESMVTALGEEVPIDDAIGQRARASDHILDAILCVIAGIDFLEGTAIAPDDQQLAWREGWIWARRP